MQSFTDLCPRFPFLQTLSRELQGPAFGYSKVQSMIKSILVELERTYDEGSPLEQANCVGAVQDLAAELGLCFEDSDVFSSLCRSVEYRLSHSK